MKKQYMSVCSVIEAITVAIEEEIKHTKILMPQVTGCISCMIPLTNISFSCKICPKFKADHTFDVEIPSEILNESKSKTTSTKRRISNTFTLAD